MPESHVDHRALLSSYSENGLERVPASVQTKKAAVAVAFCCSLICRGGCIYFQRSRLGGPIRRDFEFRTLVEEPFKVFLPSEDALAAGKTIALQEIAREKFISVSGTALSISGKQPALRRTIDKFLNENGVEIRPSHEVDNLGGVMSLILSTGGVALLPLYAKTFLPDAVTTRPLEGVGPKIDLSIGYRKANASPILKLFLSRVHELAPESFIRAAAD